MNNKTMDDKSKKCAHSGCNCPVEREGEYCGAYCEGQAGKSANKCECDHPGCKH